jgi:pilus assembly protein FimV
VILAALLLVIASTAGAASLGRLAVLSAIGEPLRAEIDLTVAAEDLESATPRLASPDAYAASGLQYNAALNGARLAIQYRQNGRRVISLMTLRPVNEPSIPVLVELDVRGGRIARTYNVLLGLSAEATASVPSPVAPAPVPAASVKTASANTARANTVPAAAVPVTAAPAAAAPRAVRAATPSKASAAPADRSRYDREIQRIESQLAAGDKILADMLDRVALMEREVRQMQHALTLQGKIPSPKPDVVAPPAGVVEQTTVRPVSTAPVAVTDSLPPQQRSRPAKQDYLNEALLVLAGGVLILLGWLAYWVWARRQSKGAGDTAEPAAES